MDEIECHIYDNVTVILDVTNAGAWIESDTTVPVGGLTVRAENSRGGWIRSSVVAENVE